MTSAFLFRFALYAAYAALGVDPTPQAPVPTETAGNLVELRQIEPLRVAYRAHKGPYWTIGPVVREVRAYMVQHQQPGPMFIRYLHDPRRRGPSLETEIGFIIGDTDEPGSGFQTATRPAERVASLAIQGRSPAPTRDYAVVFQWIDEQGLAAAGPVTELYAQDSPASRTVEVQVTLSDARGTPRVDEQATTSREVEDTSATGATDAASALPSQPGAPEPKTQTEHRTEATPTTGDANMAPSSSEEHSEEERKKPAPPVGQSESVESLIAAERFDRAARVLLPDGDAIDSALLPWLDDAFARLHAAARGVRRMYPGRGAAMLKMADALTHRLTDVSSRAAKPSPGIGARSSPRKGDQPARRRRIIQELDMLLSRIALRLADPVEAAEAMKDAVHRIDQVIHRDHALAEPGTP